MTDAQHYQAIYLAALPPGPRAARRLAAPPPLEARHWYLPSKKATRRDFHCRSSTQLVSSADTLKRVWN